MKKTFTADYENFSLRLKMIDDRQVFIVISVLNGMNALTVCENMFRELVQILAAYKITIFHERIFGSLSFYNYVDKVRSNLFAGQGMEGSQPYTYIEGNPWWGKGLAGITIHGIVGDDVKITDIRYGDQICGKMWEDEEAQYLMLQGMRDQRSKSSYYRQTLEMFRVTDQVLKEYGYESREIVRTWIYLRDIAGQYDDFNKARNHMFRQLNLMPEQVDDQLFEQMDMPASTGIEADNPFQANGVMDVYAIKKKKTSNVLIQSQNGVRQKSAFRYGSAFSRAMKVRHQSGEYLFLSGTASIDESGESVFLDDIEKQIAMTDKVIRSLIQEAGFDFSNLGEGTVFLKKPEFIREFLSFCQKNHLDEKQFIIVTANICRDDLLFELDATFMKPTGEDEKSDNE